MTTWLLITWLIASDGLPTVPIAVRVHGSAELCERARAAVQPPFMAVCRPVP